MTWGEGTEFRVRIEGEASSAPCVLVILLSPRAEQSRRTRAEKKQLLEFSKSYNSDYNNLNYNN